MAQGQTVPVPIANDDASEVDAQPVQAFRTTVRNALNHEDFAQLEEIASAARSEKSRFTGGDWKLHAFYLTVQGPGSETAPDMTWTHHMERLQRWTAAKPESVTPRVALGSAYLRYAWKVRGHGYSNTVTPEAGKLFGDRIEQARAVLEQAQALPVQDPQLYRNLLEVALTQGWSRGQEEQLFLQATARDPQYFYFYIGQANYLMPKWYGQPGDAEKFAQSAADQVGGAEGDFIYFHIAASENCCRSAQLPDLSWDRVKRGFAALEQLYGSTNQLRNVAAYMAVAHDDNEFAQQLFARIGNDWDATVWHSKEKFETSKVAAAAAK